MRVKISPRIKRNLPTKITVGVPIGFIVGGRFFPKNVHFSLTSTRIAPILSVESARATESTSNGV